MKKIDGQLISTICVIGIIFVIAAGLGLINPAGPPNYGLLALIMLLISAFLFLVIQLVLIIIRRKQLEPAPQSEANSLADRAGFFSRKSTILLVGFLVGKFVLNTLVNSPISVPILVIILLHILLLAMLGVLYARWACSEEYVPILATLVISLADSLYYVIGYAGNPSHQFRYGPEIVWFAAVGLSGRLTLIPLLSVIIWGSWKLSAIKRTTIKADRAMLIGLD